MFLCITRYIKSFIELIILFEYMMKNISIRGIILKQQTFYLKAIVPMHINYYYEKNYFKC